MVSKHKSWTAVTNPPATRLWVQVEGSDEEVCELMIPTALTSKDRRRLVQRSSLIAAAPDLLEALKVALVQVRNTGSETDELHQDVVAMACAAIRKAEGKS